MTLDEFVKKYLGTKVDFDGQWGGQCVDLYRVYVKEVLGFPQSPGVGGAAEIWDTAGDKYDYILNTPTGVPQPGDIVIWNRRVGGGFGHVAIFLSGNANSFTSLDQNWPTLDLVTKTQHTYTNVIGWLHPKENMANELEICLKDRQKFWDERDSLLRELQADSVEGGINTIRGLRSRITDLTNQLGTAQAEVTNKEEIISRLNTSLLQKDDEIKTLDDKLNLAAETITQLGKDKGNLAIEVEQLKIQVETLKQAQAEGSVTITLSDLFKLIWNQKITIKR